MCCPCCGCCYSHPQAEWIKQGQDNERIRTIIQYNTGIFCRNTYTLKSKLLLARGRANVRHICQQYALSDSSGYYYDRAKEEIEIVGEKWEELYRCIAGNDSMLFSLYHLHVSNLILYSSLLEYCWTIRLAINLYLMVIMKWQNTYISMRAWTIFYLFIMRSS